jgi:hypothetical protein
MRAYSVVARRSPGADEAARRPAADDGARPSDRIALGSALLGGVLFAAVFAARCTFALPTIASVPQMLSDTGQAPHVQVGAQPAVAAADTSTVALPTAEPAPTAQPITAPKYVVGEKLRVMGTDGQGVLLRTSPAAADVTTRGLIEGWEVTILETSSTDWARVRGPNGQEGWIPTRYLGR